jgi:protein gp37
MSFEKAYAKALVAGKYWTDDLNLFYGCQEISTGCNNCWALKFLERGLIQKNVELIPPEPGNVLSWRKDWRDQISNLRCDGRSRQPRVYFVENMGDLFHKEVPYSRQHMLFDGIREAYIDGGRKEDIYLILTKRPSNAVRFFEKFGKRYNLQGDWANNIYFGITAENQRLFIKRIKIANNLPFNNLWISAEPLLGEIRLPGIHPEYLRRVRQIIVGYESGAAARMGHSGWARRLIMMANHLAIPIFFKQWGEWIPIISASSERVPVSSAEKIFVFPDGKVKNYTDRPERKRINAIGLGAMQMVRNRGKNVRSGYQVENYTADSLVWFGGEK